MMSSKSLFNILLEAEDEICITISLNTHRTHPDNLKDIIELKNLANEAKDRLYAKYDKRIVWGLVEKLDKLVEQIDPNYCLDSLHLFVSQNIEETFFSEWQTNQQGVHISNFFAVRPLIKESSREADYMIMLLSQGGVNLFHAKNSKITAEVVNEDFPIEENPWDTTIPERKSDAGHIDKLLQEFLNRVDKSLIKYIAESNQKTVAICTDENFAHLMQVADNPAIYLGYQPVDYHNITQHQLAVQAWDFVKSKSEEEIHLNFEASEKWIGQGLISSDLQEIYLASKEGRGDILFVQEDFRQSAMLTDDGGIALVDENTGSDTVDDITSLIATEVVSKGGQCFMVPKIPNEEIAPIFLKLRY